MTLLFQTAILIYILATTFTRTEVQPQQTAFQPPTPFQTITQSPSITQSHAPSPTIQAIKNTTSIPSEPLPRGGISTIGVTTSDEKNVSYTPAGTSYTITKKDTGQSATLKSPEYLFNSVLPGTYTVTVSPGEKYIASSYSITYAKNGSFTNNGFISGSVATVTVEEESGVDVIFKLKNTSGALANPNDKQHPWVSSIKGPTEIYTSGGNAIINQKDFCVTATVTDDFTPVDKIEAQVALITVGSTKSERLYFSEWSTSKTHCFTNVPNNSYQLNFDVRDEAGNAAGFPSSFKVLSS